MRTLVFAALLAACSASPPPSPSMVRARITSDLGHVLHEVKNASDGSTVNVPGATTLHALLPVQLGATLPTLPDPDTSVTWLNEHVFTDANSLGDGVFAIPPEVVCSAGDAACAQRLADVQLRVRVEENEDQSLRFAVQVDSSHDEPLSFRLAPSELAIEIDLDGSDQAVVAVAQLFGEQAPQVQLQGAATADVTIVGPAHAMVSLQIVRALSLALAPQGVTLAEDGAFRFASAPAQVLAVELDGNAPLANVQLGLGETIVHLPGDATTRSTDIDLAGLTAIAKFAEQGTLTLGGVSLGGKTTTIGKAGATAVMIDLDPDAGRAFDAVILADPVTGNEKLTVSPLLDLRQAIDHAVLGDVPPVYDPTQLAITGTVITSPAQVQVTSGTYTLATNPAQYGFSASAGQCVSPTAAHDAASGQDYTAYAVTPCP
jgi:hypothetical protein